MRTKFASEKNLCALGALRTDRFRGSMLAAMPSGDVRGARVRKVVQRAHRGLLVPAVLLQCLAHLEHRLQALAVLALVPAVQATWAGLGRESGIQKLSQVRR